MKKIILVLLAAVICLCFFGCAKEVESTDNPDSSTEQSSTEALPEIETTKKATSNIKAAKQLRSKIKSSVNKDDIGDDAVKVSNDGSFEYKPEGKLDESQMYSREYSDKAEKLSYDNIDKFVDSIRDFYPDGDKIKLLNKDTQHIGYSDNGIDSAIYKASYINTQNQILTVYADSTGELYYAICDFTW